MGSVYRARSTVLGGIEAAVKITRPTDLEHARTRFEREIKALLRLHHPAVVRTQGFGEDPKRGLIWFAMDLVEGQPLDALLARGPLPAEHAVALFAHLADGLAHAHDRGVAHRDLKPSNVIVRNDGYPVLVDFGISAADDDGKLTATGQLVGTPQYMAPEALDGRLDDPMKADVYALGQMLVESVLGSAIYPYDPRLTSTQNALRVMNEKVKSGALDPGDRAPEPVRAVCRAATQPDPDQRTPTARTFADQLGAIARGERVQLVTGPTLVPHATSPATQTGKNAPKTPSPKTPPKTASPKTAAGARAPTQGGASPFAGINQPQAAPTMDVGTMDGEAPETTEEEPARRGGGAWIIAGGAAAVLILGGGAVLVVGVVALAAVLLWPTSPPVKVSAPIEEPPPEQPLPPEDDPAVVQVEPSDPEPPADRTGVDPAPDAPSPTLPGVRPRDPGTDRPTSTPTSPPTGTRPTPTVEPAVTTPGTPAVPTPTVTAEPEPAAPTVRADWTVVLGIRKGTKDSDAERLLGPAQVTGSDYCRTPEVPRSHLGGNVIVCQNLIGGARRVFVLNGAQRQPGAPADDKLKLLGMTYDQVEAAIGPPQGKDGSGRWRYNNARVWLDFSGGKVRAFFVEF
jgi:serine/threonine-protein kinase